MMYRDFGMNWTGWGAASFVAYVVTKLRPDSEIALAAFSLLCLTTITLFFLWLAESMIFLLRRFWDWRVEVMREQAVISDPDAVLADIMRKMNRDALDVFASLVETNFDENENKPLPGFQYLTKSFALRFFAHAMPEYPNLPSIRRARGEYMPREQATELTDWLIGQRFAKAGRGSSPAQWVSVDAKLQAAQKFWAT